METTPPEDDTHLIPGASVGGGRYRLLVFHGGPPGLQFWQALDTALDRQVALTFVDPDRTLPAEQVQEILARTLKLSRLERPGVARVLDVANTGSGGLVVSEWIRGGSLKEVADTSPSPIGGARAIQALAAAAGDGPRGRRRTVHRSPQPGAGQYRRRCGTGISRDDAARHPRGRHPRNRGRALRPAGRSLAAARDRGAQRPGTRREGPRGRAAGTPRRQPRDSLPDFGGRRPLGSGRWRNPQCRNSFEPSPAGDGGSRPHRSHRAHRGGRTGGRPASPPRTTSRRRPGASATCSSVSVSAPGCWSSR